MLQYSAHRLLAAVLVLLASTVVLFLMLHLAPGDPATVLLGGRPATAAAIANLNATYHLKDPLYVQYGAWLFHLVQGNLGYSVSGHDTVVAVIRPRLATTLLLTSAAAMLMLLIGIPLGIAGGVYRNGAVDLSATLGALTFTAIPAYVMGLVLILIFGVQLQWLPTLGSGEGGGISSRLDHLVLPAFALALSALALVSRITRSAMITSLSSEHVEASRIRGLSETRVVLKHALRSALVPVVTIAGVQTGYLLAGAVLVENVFGLNGLGTLLVSSAQSKDFAVVQAIALIITAAFLAINFLVDLLYGWIDPRVRITDMAH